MAKRRGRKRHSRGNAQQRKAKREVRALHMVWEGAECDRWEQQGCGNKLTASQMRDYSIQVTSVVLSVMVEEALTIDPQALSSNPISAKLKELKERNAIPTTLRLQ